MKKILFWTGNLLFFIISLSYVFMLPVRAYFDPATVTYVFQAIATIVVAIGALATIFRHRIIDFFKKDKNESKREIHLKKDIDNEDDIETISDNGEDA